MPCPPASSGPAQLQAGLHPVAGRQVSLAKGVKAILARAVNVAFQKQNLLFVSRTVRVRYAKRQFAVVAERAVRLALGLDCKMRAQRGPPDPGSCGKPRSGGGYLPSRRFPDETRYRPDHSCACHPWPTRSILPQAPRQRSSGQQPQSRGLQNGAKGYQIGDSFLGGRTDAWSGFRDVDDTRQGSRKACFTIRYARSSIRSQTHATLSSSGRDCS